MHVAYRWLCGGVSVNHHSLSDFRSDSEEQFGEVIVQIVSSLMSQGLVSLKRLAQDGMKIRVSAEEITKLAKRGVNVFSPVKNAAKSIAAGKAPYAAKPGDTDEVAE